MRAFNLFLAMMTVVAYQAAPIFAQETAAQDPRVKIELLRIGFLNDGTPAMYRHQHLTLPLIQPWAELMGYPHVRDELDIVESQWGEWEEILRQYRRAESKLFSALSVVQMPAERDAAIAQAVMDISDIQAKVEGLLMPHQTAKLEQISRYLHYHRHGLDSFIVRTESLHNLGLTPAEKMEIERACAQLERGYLERCEAIFSKFIQDLMPMFAKHDGEDFANRYDMFRDPVWCDIVLANEHLLDAPSDQSSPTNLEDVLGMAVWYEFAGDHNWHRKQSRSQPVRGLVAIIRDSEAALEDEILFPGQAGAIMALNVQYTAEHRMISEQYNDRLDRRGEDRDIAFEWLKEEGRQLEARYYSKLWDEVLVPQQREWILEKCNTYQMATYGPLAPLQGVGVGAAGRKSLSEDDLSQMRELVRRLRGDLLRMEADLLSKQLQAIPERGRTEIEGLVGDRPSFLQPKLSIINSRVQK